MKVRWTGPALADLNAQADYIAQDSPPAADAVVGRVFNAADQLMTHPRLGRIHAESGARLLAVRGTSLLLIYDVDEVEVRVLHVRHMARQPYGEDD